MAKHEHQCDENCELHCEGLCCTKIESFGVKFGANVILEDVSMHIHCGELTAIIGPNGAGKSTLLRAMLGEIKHTGELLYENEAGAKFGTGGGGKPKSKPTPLIGYVPQHLNFDLSTPTSVLDLFLACRTRKPAWLVASRKVRVEATAILARVKAEHLIHRKLGTLSGGELQRVLLALALDPVPDLLLLDEPVSGIDQHGLELFYKTVSEIRKEYDLSIILISHDLALVSEYADRVILLNKSVIKNGSPKEVFGDSEAQRLFGVAWARGADGGAICGEAASATAEAGSAATVADGGAICGEAASTKEVD